MSERSLLYDHFRYLAAVTDPVTILTPQALLNCWLTDTAGPPATSPQSELAALDMALACLYEPLYDYFLTNTFDDRLAAASVLLAAARQEYDDLTVQRLAGELSAALAAADEACRLAARNVAEDQPPLD